MKNHWLLMTSLLVISGVLSACQSATRPQTADPAQINQLAALVSAAGFVRDNCQSSGIPGNNGLVATAARLARDKGKPLTQAETGRVQSEADKRYTLLTEDNVPLKQKCDRLRPLVDNFVTQASNER